MTLKSGAKFEDKLTLGSKNYITNLVSFNANSNKSEVREKYIKFEPKKYRGVMCHNTEEWYKIWRETDLCFEKWDEEFDEFWLSTPKSQNLHFNGVLLTKVFNVWAKKYREAMPHYTEDRCKLRKKKWFVVP